MSRTIKLLISNWPRTREFSQLLQTGKLFLNFLTMVTRCSRSTSSFYDFIGQNLTDEYMRKFMHYLKTCLLRVQTYGGPHLPRQNLLFLGKTYFWTHLDQALAFLSSLGIDFISYKMLVVGSIKWDFECARRGRKVRAPKGPQTWGSLGTCSPSRKCLNLGGLGNAICCVFCRTFSINKDEEKFSN